MEDFSFSHCHCLCQISLFFFFLLSLHQLFRSRLPDLLLILSHPTHCQGASIESAPTLTCRRSPDQIVISLAITFSLSSSTPLPPTPIVPPVRSLGLPTTLHHSLKCNHFHCSTALAVQMSGNNSKQSGQPALVNCSVAHASKQPCNSTTVKVGCCTC